MRENLSADLVVNITILGFWGLDFYNDTIVIGQSQDMYLSDRVAQGDSVSVDSGVHLFDTDSKALRFVPINKIMNIHDLMVLSHVE